MKIIIQVSRINNCRTSFQTFLSLKSSSFIQAYCRDLTQIVFWFGQFSNHHKFYYLLFSTSLFEKFFSHSSYCLTKIFSFNIFNFLRNLYDFFKSFLDFCYDFNQFLGSFFQLIRIESYFLFLLFGLSFQLECFLFYFLNECLVKLHYFFDLFLKPSQHLVVVLFLRENSLFEKFFCCQF